MEIAFFLKTFETTLGKKTVVLLINKGLIEVIMYMLVIDQLNT